MEYDLVYKGIIYFPYTYKYYTLYLPALKINSLTQR